jgi:hypothetical protein
MVTDFDKCKARAVKQDDGKLAYPLCSVEGLHRGNTDDEVDAWLALARSDAAQVGATFEVQAGVYFIVWAA